MSNLPLKLPNPLQSQKQTKFNRTLRDYLEIALLAKITKRIRLLLCQRSPKVNLSFQMGDGSALNAKTIISREERNVIDVRSQEQSRT